MQSKAEANVSFENFLTTGTAPVSLTAKVLTDKMKQHKPLLNHDKKAMRKKANSGTFLNILNF